VKPPAGGAGGATERRGHVTAESSGTCGVAGCVDPGCLHPGRRRVLAWESARFAEWLARVYPEFWVYVEADWSDEWGACAGAHHPGRPCDYWGVCSGAAYTYPEHRALRVGVAA
jgi:hypothetical protein